MPYGRNFRIGVLSAMKKLCSILTKRRTIMYDVCIVALFVQTGKRRLYINYFVRDERNMKDEHRQNSKRNRVPLEERVCIHMMTSGVLSPDGTHGRCLGGSCSSYEICRSGIFTRGCPALSRKRRACVGDHHY